MYNDNQRFELYERRGRHEFTIHSYHTIFMLPFLSDNKIIIIIY